MAWLPGGEKNFEDIFIRFDATHERDRQTDGRTPHADIYRAYAYAYDNMLSRFHPVPERHGQTDRQSQLLSLTRYKNYRPTWRLARTEGSRPSPGPYKKLSYR